MDASAKELATGAINKNAASMQMFRWLRLEQAPTLFARVSARSTLTVTECRYDHTGFGATDPARPQDAFALGLILREHPVHELRTGNKIYPVQASIPGDAFFYDMTELHSAATKYPFHWLMVVLPRTFLDELSEDFGAPRITRVGGLPGVPVRDPTLAQLSRSLRAFTAATGEADDLSADHLMLALGTYACAVYGDLVPTRRTIGGLNHWQERVAKELIESCLATGVTLRELATNCGLGTSQFAHAFKVSVGCAPYEWLLHRRVERAKRLLIKPGQPLANIAQVCGFADQSHFTRVFRRETAKTPRVWRSLL